MQEVTIVLPCAGKGARMGLPFPKELAPLSKGRIVIDSCLSVIAKTSAYCRIIVMDDGTREQTHSYVSSQLPDIPLAMVRQHRYSSDFPDAVIRLEPWLGDVNILLLPDAVYEFTGDPAGQLAGLAAESGFAVAAARVPPEEISRAGALAVAQDNLVRAYQDKPSDPSPFNAVWGMLGFSGKIGMAGLRVIAASTVRQGQGKPPVVGAPVLWLDGYRDCGTWDSYKQERENS